MLADYKLHQDDSVGDSLHLKNFLYPFFHHKHSYTSSAFVISGPAELVPDVLTLDCAAVATMVSGLLNAAESTFLWDSVSTTSQTSSQSVNIECSYPEFSQMLA